MEVLLKILYFLCLSSATISVQLVPSLNINTPVLDLAIGGINKNIQNNANSISNSPFPQSKKCFCIPTNTNSLPVTNNMDPLDDTQRLVIYLYKNKGNLKIYVPNKNKQKILPELNFDGNEGDILKIVSSESIVDIFDSEIVRPLENTVTIPEDVVKETETLVTENNILEPNMKPVKLFKPSAKPAYIPFNEHNQYIVSSNDNPSDKPWNENNEHLSVSTNENTVAEEDISIEEEGIPVDNISQPSRETQNEAQTSQIIFAPQSRPERINNLNIVIDNQDVGTITNLQDSDQQQSVITITDLQQQGQSSIKLLPNPYITFNDWFNVQLSRVIIHNIETQIQISQLRQKIKKILQGNGMTVSAKGIVTDSNRNLVRMNNLKLRPILIGGIIDAQNFSYQPNLPQTGIKYVQLIEVILVSPPKLLGTLVLGTVYLPRNIQGEQNLSLESNHKENIKNNYGWLIKQGCTSCKSNPASGSRFPGIRYSAVTVPGVGVQGVGVQGVDVQGVGVQGVGVPGVGVQGVDVQGVGVQGVGVPSDGIQGVGVQGVGVQGVGVQGVNVQGVGVPGVGVPGVGVQGVGVQGVGVQGVDVQGVGVQGVGVQGVGVQGVRVSGVRVPAVPVSAVPARTVTVPYSSYGSYYASPFRGRILKNGFPYKGPITANVNPYRHNNNLVSTERAGILDGVLGSIGPILFGNPSRRILGGRLPQGSKPGPKSYPNDDLPGFRIIGGNAATSSGTPLVNKGRSGFEKTSHII